MDGRENEAPGGVLRGFRHSPDHGALAAVQHEVLRTGLGGLVGHVRLLRLGLVGGTGAAVNAEF